MRTNKKVIYIGTTSTGKTSFIKNLIDDFPHPKTLIVDCAENPEWSTMETYNHPEWASRKIPIMPLDKLPYHKSGIYHIFSEDTEYLEEMIANHVINTTLIIEDATQWYESTLTKNQKKTVLRSKQVNVDYHIIFHTIADVPPRLIRYCDYVVLFKTGESTYDNKKITSPGFAKAFQEVRDSPDKHIHRIIKLK